MRPILKGAWSQESPYAESHFSIPWKTKVSPDFAFSEGRGIWPGEVG